VQAKCLKNQIQNSKANVSASGGSKIATSSCNNSKAVSHPSWRARFAGPMEESPADKLGEEGT
jgi:hypothetical protein